jgi:hypothetical protein
MGRSRPLDELLAEALAKPRGRDREHWIATTCGEDAALELELRRLLAAHESAGPFLTRPACDEEESAGAALDRRRSRIRPRELE